MSDEEQPEGTPISVHDKEHPALAATLEAQNISTLDRIVVPPGAYTDPGNPAAAAGSINMSVYTHPAELPEDYGEGVEPGEDDVRGVIDAHAEEAAAGVQTAQQGTPGGKHAERPEDREEWTKANWVSQAEEYGLAKSGNTDAVKDRVEEFEAQVEEADGWSENDWQNAVEDTETQTELTDLRRLYDASDFGSVEVEQAFTDKQAAISGSE